MLMASAPGWAANTDVVGFCRFHPDLDDPGLAYFGPEYRPGTLPAQVEAAGATDWRCMDGAAMLCLNSADGTTCGRLDTNTVPSRLLRELCQDSPGLDLIPTYAAGISTSVWRCRGRSPAIMHTARVDRRGYLVGAWVRYVVRNGAVLAPRPGELGHDPRWAGWPAQR